MAPAPGARRVSYNGGPGGVALKPTPEQERLTTEEHIRPTPQQISQARTASMDAMQFHSANQGKPAVAATARPGDLKGPGAVPAKAAGSAALAPAAGEPRPGAPGAAPNLERRLPNGAPAPAGERPGAPGAERNAPPPPRANLGEKPPAPAETGPAQRLNAPVPINAPKAQERPAQEKAPGGPPKPQGVEGPVRREGEPNRESRTPQVERPAMAPPGGDHAVRPEPNRESRTPQIERPAVAAPGGERPRVEAAPGGGPKGTPGAAERKPQRPEGRPGECGKPGEPPCR